MCTDLVVYPLGGVGKVDALLELVADLLHLLALAPVIEGPCHVDLVAGVRPVMQKDGRVSLDAHNPVWAICAVVENNPRWWWCRLPSAAAIAIHARGREMRTGSMGHDRRRRAHSEHSSRWGAAHGGALSSGGMAAASLWTWWMGSVMALALADYGAPKSGVREAC